MSLPPSRADPKRRDVSRDVADFVKGTMIDTLRPPLRPNRTSPARPIWFVPACAVLGAPAIWLVVAPLAGVELFETGGTTAEASAASVVVGSAIGGLGAVAHGGPQWFQRRVATSLS